MTTTLSTRPSPRRWGRWLPLLTSVPGLMFIALPICALIWLGVSSEAMQALWRPASLQAIRVSLGVASAATLLCAVLGLPIAWWLSRDPQFGAQLGDDDVAQADIGAGTEGSGDVIMCAREPSERGLGRQNDQRHRH